MGESLPPLALYVHVPYCVRKCSYCDFYSTAPETRPESAYLATVERELLFWRKQLRADDRPLHSLFFGGGTPSLLQAETIGRILTRVRSLWPLADAAEITLEANPESCHIEKMALWRAFGINRLSLGIQALDPDRLTLLGRPHTLDQAWLAFESARHAGFSTINLDLIFATPGQTLRRWLDELTQAMTWQPEHFSCYGLTFEIGTPFDQRRRRGELSPLSEEEEWQLLTTTEERLSSAGWQGYEISNFAKPDQTCQHNLNYWRSGDFLGIGPGAHGRLSSLATRNGAGKGDQPRLRVRRTVNRREGYLHQQTKERGGLASDQINTPEASGQECLLMGLRLREGMRRQTYRDLTGIDLLAQKSQELEQLREDGMIQWCSERVALTPKGFPLADTILLALI